MREYEILVERGAIARRKRQIETGALRPNGKKKPKRKKTTRPKSRKRNGW